MRGRLNNPPPHNYAAGSNPAICKKPTWRNWIAHPVPNWKAVGSSPIVGTIFRHIPCSLMVRIAGFHPADPGSIPGMEAKRI